MNTVTKTLQLILLLNLTSIYCMEQHNTQSHIAKDSILLLELPYDIFKSILCYAGEKNLRLVFNTLYSIKHVCKKLHALKIDGELKIICQPSQENIDEALPRCPKKDDFPYIKTLLAIGANVNYCNYKSYTYLHRICASSCEKEDDTYIAQLTKLCIEKHNAQVNELDHEGHTPLHWAASRGLTKTIQTLLEHNAQLNQKNLEGYTPIGMALRSEFISEHRRFKVVKLLILYGLDTTISYKVDYDRYTTLATWAAKHGYMNAYNLITAKHQYIGFRYEH
jgi:ankyrin repeat protein